MTDVANLRSLQNYDDASRPKGLWQGAPALAASGVAMTNTSKYAIRLYVSSATNVTAVAVDGVTLTGFTTQTFMYRLRRGGTIAFTYTSTGPVLQWMYE